MPGLRVIAHSDHGVLADAIASGWSGAGASEKLPGGDHTLRLFSSHPALEAFPEVEVQGYEIFDREAFNRTMKDAGLRGDYHGDLRFWQIYDPETRLGAQLMTGPTAFPPWEPGSPFRSFLHWHYASVGMRLIHGGTLGLNGKGILFVGRGGAGKSGTVLAGVLSGLDSVGDDYVLVSLQGGVTAYPLFRTLKQDKIGWDRLKLDERLRRPTMTNWQGKYQFCLEDVAPRPIPSKMLLSAIVVSRVANKSRTTISTMARRDSIVAVSSTGLAQMTGDRTSGFRFCSELTRLLPCYGIELGNDPHEVAQTVGEFMERTVS